MQSIIGISKDKHRSLFVDKKRYEKPDTAFVFGRDLLDNKVTWSHAGSIPKLIHQTWKNDLMPSRWKQYFDGWAEHHPDFVHVLWTDEDNEELVRAKCNEFLDSYSWLPLMIQKTDFVRLMYLYYFGGIYTDLDYECFNNLLPHLPQLQGVMLVESPLTFTEITQNSLMIAEPGHPYVYSAMQLISEIIQDMKDQQGSKYPFKHLFQNLFVGKMLHTLSTLFITGPAVLDKAYVRAHLTNRQASRVGQVTLLPHAKFYEGTVAKHHHNGSWFDGEKLLQMFFIVIGLTVTAIILTCVLSTFFSTKAVLKKKLVQRF